MPIKQITNWDGINGGIGARDSDSFFQTLVNFDSNLEKGLIKSRKGYTTHLSTVVPNIDKFVEYRDEERGYDVLLVYSKTLTVADRKFYAFHKITGADAYTFVGTFNYGSVEIGEEINFFVSNNSVRIGTGSEANNKALTFGYIDRSVGSNDDAMFNDNIAFSKYVMSKQQWVQQGDLTSAKSRMIYDSTADRYYTYSLRGIEIRDSDFHIIKIIDDVQQWGAFLESGLWLQGDYLFAYGNDKDALNNVNYLLNVYEVSDDYRLISSLSTTPEAMDVVADSTYVYALPWVSFGGTNYQYLRKYTHDLTLTATYSDAVGNNKLTHLTIDTVNSLLYAIGYDSTANVIIQQFNLSLSLLGTYDTGIAVASYSPSGISIDSNGDLFWMVRSGVISPSTDSTTIYKTTPAGTFSSSTKAVVTAISGDCQHIHIDGNDIYIANDTCGFYYHYNNTTTWDFVKYLPSKISLGIPGSYGGNSYKSFYGITIVDIWGQESHLMTGLTGGEQWKYRPIIISVNGLSQYYQDELYGYSPSLDPTDQLSVWNEFSKIKKLKLYRAHGQQDSGYPTDDYRFLAEIDINNYQWVSPTAQKFIYVYADLTPKDEISSYSFTGTTGLPAVFKPRYTNWKHVAQLNNFYYYGNIYSDQQYLQMILETPEYSPDVAYLTDENFTLFGANDADEIKGFATSWNRLVVMKGQMTGIYNGINQELVQNIGLASTNSIVTHNNVVYFAGPKRSFYALTPSEYVKISNQIDPFLTGSSFVDVSAVFFREKEKIWFMIPGSYSWLFNIRDKTWDSYSLSSDQNEHILLDYGLDGSILTAANTSTGGLIYVHNDSEGDSGQNITIRMKTNSIIPGNGIINFLVNRIYITYKCAAAFTLYVYYVNENVRSYKSFSMPAQEQLQTVRKFTTIHAQEIYFYISTSLSTPISIDMLGFEYKISRTDRVNNG